MKKWNLKRAMHLLTLFLKNNLSEMLYPTNWFKTFLSNRIDKVSKHSANLWTIRTNLKALLSNIRMIEGAT